MTGEPESTPAEQLRNIMRQNNLTNLAVSDILGVSVKTVESWLADPMAASHRSMPARYLRLLPQDVSQ